jgi:HD-GYP domain-containing protein (c-di-GMP phosphodiesterase class II)
MTVARRLSLREVADLMAPGQPLPFRVLDGAGRLLLAEGQVILDARQLKALMERGACVEQLEAEQARRVKAQGGQGGSVILSTRKLTWFDRFEQQTWALDELLRAVGKGEPVSAQIEAFGDAFIDLVERQPDAALFLAVRHEDRRFALYALTHALGAATVSLLAARQLGWAAPRARVAVLATLTMNAAIVELQARMAEQKDPPTKAQLDQIRSHPECSAALLQAAGVTDEDWLRTVRDHHERAGGQGYPRGDREPDELARLVRAADVFTAKISARALRPAMPPQQAARQLFQEEGGGPLAGALIKSVGVYPPGDFVLLKNGETAVVVLRSGPRGAPVVAALLSAQAKPVPGTPRRDTSEPEFAIAGPVPERSRMARVLPEVVYGLLM